MRDTRLFYPSFLSLVVFFNHRDEIRENWNFEIPSHIYGNKATFPSITILYKHPGC